MEVDEQEKKDIDLLNMDQDSIQKFPMSVDYFMQEEVESKLYTPEKIFELYDNIGQELVTVLHLVAEAKMSEDHKAILNFDETEIVSAVMEMKRLNRLDKHNAKRSSDTVNKCQQNLDALKFEYQNLFEEKNYLQNEINKCLNHKSVVSEIDLLPLEEFCKDAAQEEMLENDDELLMARLEYELKVRNKLVQEFNDAEIDRDMLTRNIKKMKEEVFDFYPALTDVTKAVSKLQGKHLPLQGTHVKRKTARFLSLPLYSLYREASSYSELYDKSVHVSIVGSTAEAKALLAKVEDIDTDENMSDIEKEGEEKESDKKNGGRKEADNKNEGEKKDEGQKRERESEKREREDGRKDRESEKRERESEKREKDGDKRERDIDKRERDSDRRDRDSDKRERDSDRRDRDSDKRERDSDRRDRDGDKRERDSEKREREGDKKGKESAKTEDDEEAEELERQRKVERALKKLARQKRRAAAEAEDKALCKKHPLKIHLAIVDKEIEIHLEFAFLHNLNLVTVCVKSVSTSLTSSPAVDNILSPDTIFNCLFPDDNHRNFSSFFYLNSEEEEKGDKKNSKVQFLHDTTGWPYSWVQKIVGLGFAHVPQLESIDDECLIQTTLDASITALKSRLKVRALLNSEIHSIVPGLKIREDLALFYPQTVYSQLTQWSVASWEDVLAHSNIKELLMLNAVDKEAMFYKAVIVRESAALTSVISIFPDYPKRPPVFLLFLNPGSDNKQPSDLALKELEKEVNVCCIENIPENKDILICQLHHLRACFDVFWETELFSKPLEGAMTRACISEICRGPKRNRPYRFSRRMT